MARVFISYGRENAAQAQALAADLTELGHAVWRDSELSGGQAWWDQILQQIRSCEVFVLALSPDSVESVACRREWTYAIELRRNLMPVLVADGVSNDLLPPQLAQIHYTDYREQDKKALMRLMKAINLLPPPLPLPEPLPAPPVVPISYLGGLREQIESSDVLPFQAQTALLVTIRQGLRTKDQQEALLTLLKVLRARDDLFARVADEIDELISTGRQAVSDSVPPQAPTSGSTATRKATGEAPNRPSAATSQARSVAASPPVTRRPDRPEAIAWGAVELRDLVRLVGACYGPSGRPVRLATGSGEPLITSRPIQVIEQFTPAEPVAAATVKLVRAAALSVHDVAGAGAATTVILAQAILEKASEAMQGHASPAKFIKSIESSAESCIEEMKRLARPCNDRSELAAIASHASRDPWSNIIAEAVEKVGKEGPVTIETGRGISDELEVVEGMRFHRGYLSPHFVTEPDGVTAVLKDVCILQCDGKIRDIRPLVPLFEQIARIDRSLLIIAEDVEGGALEALVDLNSRGGIKLAAVKCEGFGDRRKALLDDIAVLTGGTPFGGERELQVDGASVEHLGRARRVRVEQECTTIIDAAGDPAAIKARATELQRESEEVTSDYDREKLQDRFTRLASGVAIVTVGAATAAECVERTKRLETARLAVSAAIDEGIVPGAGHALLRAAAAVAKRSDKSNDEAMSVVLQACREPLMQLARNAGEDPDKVLGDVLAKAKPQFGFDPSKGQIGDLFKAGVIDSASSMCLALRNAASISRTVLWSSLTP